VAGGKTPPTRYAKRMCGIVGLFLKDPHLEPEPGMLVAGMLSTLCHLRKRDARRHQADLARARGSRLRLPDETIGDRGRSVPRVVRDTHMVVTLPPGRETAIRATLVELAPEVSVVGVGRGSSGGRDRTGDLRIMSSACRKRVCGLPIRTCDSRGGTSPGEWCARQKASP
jgi:hypothetical protein